ncbi:unnamed protein product, partial [Brassica napus]
KVCIEVLCYYLRVPVHCSVIEEMRARDRHTLELAEKVDFLTFMTDYETEQKLGKLEKIVSELG